MNRKKKKNTAIKASFNVRQQEIALKSRFIGRITQLFILYGGQELADRIPAIYIEKLFECRYPILKAKTAEGSKIPKSRIVQFNKLLYKLMEDMHVLLENGNKVPLSWYISEGITLIDAMSNLAEGNDPSNDFIVKPFEAYFPDTAFYIHVQNQLQELLYDTIRFFSDYNESILQLDTSTSACFEPFYPSNDILIHAFKPEAVTLTLKDGAHSTKRLGWVLQDLKWEYVKIKPSALGFKTGIMDIPLNVYVQTHALDRLRERINITPGIMHEILFLIFMQDKIEYSWHNGSCLVTYRISSERAGYLVVKLHTDKLVIHTFLFLTNDDTPEGDKLKKLLEIEKADKQYMHIDNLPAFNAYHIDTNEQASKLFRDAGCGSLLKLGHLQEFTVNQIKDKDPDSILEYLADARYFRKEEGLSIDEIH
jgi:hypothetical protein